MIHDTAIIVYHNDLPHAFYCIRVVEIEISFFFLVIEFANNNNNNSVLLVLFFFFFNVLYFYPTIKLIFPSTQFSSFVY